MSINIIRAMIPIPAIAAATPIPAAAPVERPVLLLASDVAVGKLLVVELVVELASAGVGVLEG